MSSTRTGSTGSVRRAGEAGQAYQPETSTTRCVVTSDEKHTRPSAGSRTMARFAAVWPGSKLTVEMYGSVPHGKAFT